MWRPWFPSETEWPSATERKLLRFWRNEYHPELVAAQLGELRPGCFRLTPERPQAYPDFAVYDWELAIEWQPVERSDVPWPSVAERRLLVFWRDCQRHNVFAVRYRDCPVSVFQITESGVAEPMEIVVCPRDLPVHPEASRIVEVVEVPGDCTPRLIMLAS